MSNRKLSKNPEYNKYEFDISFNNIQARTWIAHREDIFKGLTALKQVFIPYCKEHGLIEETIRHEYDKKEKRRVTKNWDFYLYEHQYKDIECFIHSTSTHTYLYIFVTFPKYDIEDLIDWKEDEIENVKHLKETFFIGVSLYSKYSDDEYMDAREVAVNNVLKHIDKTKNNKYYNVMIWNSVCCPRDEEKVTIKELINTRKNPADLCDGWEKMIFELSCDFHYLDVTTEE